MSTVAANLINLLEPDKGWFDRNPDRRYRFRSMTPEEQRVFPGPDSFSLHLLDSGDVMVMPLRFGSLPTNEVLDDESFAQIIFNYATHLQEPGIAPLEAMNRVLHFKSN